MTKRVRFVHFNDVYRIGPKDTEPVGGAARFVRAIHDKAPDALVVFSGDCFNPSLLSSATKGAHMVPVLNKCNIVAATYGNHDLDFGEDTLIKLSNDCNFPWLLANMHHADGSCIGTAKNHLIHEHNDLRIGFFGLGEEEWVGTLPDPPENMVYRDFIEVAHEQVKFLKEQKCDLIVAITHMRLPNDQRLADSVPGLDLVFGGHDHFYKQEQHGDCFVSKSGTDFQEFTILEAERGAGGERWQVKSERIEVVGSMPQDSEMEKLVEDMEAHISETLDKVVGYTETDWDVRAEAVRTKESNVGNFFAGVMRLRYGAELGLLCGGTLRSDTVYEAGPITARDINTILPFQDPCVVLSITGQQLLEALENGVSKYPAHDGRFPQISGFRFTFDPAMPPMERVVEVLVGEEHEELDLNRTYRLATRYYLATGHDGYDILQKCPEILDHELGSLLSTIVISALKEVTVVKRWKERHSMLRGAIAAWKGIRPWTQRRPEQEGCIVCPRPDGRIQTVEQRSNSVPPEKRTRYSVSYAYGVEVGSPQVDHPLSSH
ncbi:uncharacterized protein MONBRDRAFT_30021 [Monosiga brevicollis MX1]|uniref:5'-Nucleotidase C-terminal domain-containing protein n=1 Tax=Monosiga brevicollis TaxID=81824 RepID=A9VCS7_MONBE|nr:uncharacterized protein MONBRDRAFT_30021 [Monosiga brevicollis MX1]EDQ84618.1 predicted protein [Monosiga brevicollis MX1]|eukprot:XP_001750522.1 hypothetical protein [Monosiga brevicollis MX1]